MLYMYHLRSHSQQGIQMTPVFCIDCDFKPSFDSTTALGVHLLKEHFPGQKFWGVENAREKAREKAHEREQATARLRGCTQATEATTSRLSEEVPARYDSLKNRIFLTIIIAEMQ
jgi:hypothetical protein